MEGIRTSSEACDQRGFWSCLAELSSCFSLATK
ncbi:hypothetical protein SETIT_9G067100v2 [Setaria italica]|uniref:Uncharacterized protein n=1 Tax=Setaria italica TaxID=4555 RepID=A0A368SFL2_SETIT|nr:hypothetical protein SETIT_9G067100v2 [Setaria italica]